MRDVVSEMIEGLGIIYVGKKFVFIALVESYCRFKKIFSALIFNKFNQTKINIIKILIKSITDELNHFVAEIKYSSQDLSSLQKIRSDFESCLKKLTG